MTGQPLFEPNSPRAPRPSNQESWHRSAAPLSIKEEADVIQVARTLAAHGGGPLSFDLALDLVLNEAVDDAMRVTGATGAAIAFARDGEMVCRASAGPNAPELGVRLETRSGLSGACLQTGTLQRCDDSESDPRVDAAACRQLGVRSILMMPLSQGKEPFGILQVFSPQSHAFGEREIALLDSLVRRVVENKKAADDGPAFLESEEEPPATAEENENPEELRHIEVADQQPSLDHPERQAPDRLTSVLSAVVVVVALLLILLIGWRVGLIPGFQRGLLQKAIAPSNANTDPDGGAAANQKGPGTLKVSGSAKKASGPIEPPAGGLVVTENGKVIFQQTPTDAAVARDMSSAPDTSGMSVADAPTSTQEVSKKVAESLLLIRVEPDYPFEARTQRIQGIVILNVEVGSEGSVQNASAVSGNAILARAAIAAVKQWKYRPYSVAGKPVDMQTQVVITFTLPPS